MSTTAETLEYIASLFKELAEMSDDLGRPTLSYLLRMAMMEAEGGLAASNKEQLSQSFVCRSHGGHHGSQ